MKIRFSCFETKKNIFLFFVLAENHKENKPEEKKGKIKNHKKKINSGFAFFIANEENSVF